jgi:hypothetical protein
MKRYSLQLAAAVLCTASILVLASCNNDKPLPTAAPPQSELTVTTQPGVAGGSATHVFTVEAIVTAVDQSNRHVTLKDSEGDEFTFVAEPEVKNLPQVHVGDKVTGTFTRRIFVAVRADDASPSVSHETARGTAMPGEKPGVLVAEESEAVARVVAIDTVNRTADLQFVNGLVKSVPVRSDVDLSKYNVGDSVVIRATTSLTILVETPVPTTTP